MQMMWGGINSMQIISHIPLANINLPQASLYLFSFISEVVSFEYLNPKDWVDSPFMETPPFRDEYDDLGYEDMIFLHNIGHISVLVAAIHINIFLYPCYRCLTTCACLCKTIRDKGDQYKFKVSLVSNSMIRLGIEIYFDILVAALIGLQLIKDNKYEDLGLADRISVIFNYVFLVILFLFIIFVSAIACFFGRKKIEYERTRRTDDVATVHLQQIRSQAKFEETVDYGPHLFFKNAF